MEFCWFCGEKQFCGEIPGFYNPTFLENLAGVDDTSCICGAFASEFT